MIEQIERECRVQRNRGEGIGQTSSPHWKAGCASGTDIGMLVQPAES